MQDGFLDRKKSSRLPQFVPVCSNAPYGEDGAAGGNFNALVRVKEVELASNRIEFVDLAKKSPRSPPTERPNPDP